MSIKQLNCHFCDQLIEGISISLPCGFIVCRKHLGNEAKYIDCIICKDHRFNVKECLDMPRNKQNIRQYEYDAKKEILTTRIHEYNRMNSDPNGYIEESFKHILDKVEKRKDALKVELDKRIDEYYNKLVADLKADSDKSKTELKEKVRLIDIKRVEDEKNAIEDELTAIQYNISNKIAKLETSIEFLTILNQKFEPILEVSDKGKMLEVYTDQQELSMEKIFGVLRIAEPVVEEIRPVLTEYASISKIEFWKTFEGHKGSVFCMSIAENEAITGAADKTIKIWDITTGECSKTLLGHRDSVNDLKVLDGGEIISASDDKTIKLWDKTTGKCIKTFDPNTDEITCLIVSKSGEIISGSWDCKIKTWDKVKGKPIKTLEGHDDGVVCLQLMETGELLSGSWDKTIKIWDLAGAKCLKTIEAHDDAVRTIQIIDKDYFASCSADKKIKIWDAHTGECFKVLDGHTDAVWSLQIYQEREIISASSDKTIKIWDLQSGQCIKTLEQHTSHVLCLQLLKSGKLFSGSADKTIKVWE